MGSACGPGFEPTPSELAALYIRRRSPPGLAPCVLKTQDTRLMRACLARAFFGNEGVTTQTRKSQEHSEVSEEGGNKKEDVWTRCVTA